MSADCTYVSKSFEDRANSLRKIHDSFKDKDIIKQFDGPTQASMWKRLLYQVTDNEYRMPTVEELKLLTRVVDRNIKNIGKDRGKLAKALYLPSEIYKDIPFLRDWYEDVTRSSITMKGNQQLFNNGLNQIINILKPIAAKEGIKIKKVQQQLTDYYKQFNKLQQEGKTKEAKLFYEKEIQPYVIEGEARILRQFHELATMPVEKYKKARVSGEYANVARAVAIWRGESGVEGLQAQGREILIQGLKQFKNVFKNNYEFYKRELNNFEQSYKQIDNLINRFNSGELQKDGYFPVLTFDILPTLSKAGQLLYNSKDTKSSQQGIDLIGSVGSILDSNVYLNKHLKEMSNIDSHLDYNVIPLIHSYGNSVARFNYAVYNSAKFIEAQQKMSELLQNNKNKDLEKKINFLKTYMSDTYAMVDGSKFEKSPMMTDVARGITAFEFASKLGLNIRGAARNATQSLFNYVWFGSTGIKEYRQALLNSDMRVRIEKGLKNNGILFPEIAEVYGSKLTKTEYDPNTGAYREVVDLSMSDNILSKMETIAETLGKPMSWVENRLNRRLTFGIAYAKAWNTDANNPRLTTNLFESKYIRSTRNGKEALQKLKEDSVQYEKEYNAFLERRAENYANDMVNIIHFDYSMPGKSKILSSPAGSVLGQFQHYGINFFNLQRKIVRDGADAVFTNQWTSPAAYRMYRLGLMYTVINGILGPMLNFNTGNLVQNDTYERLKSYYYSLDEEKRKEQFFGKGPFIGTLGGPFISDMVGVFNAVGIYQMEPNSTIGWLAGAEQMAEENSNSYTEKILGFLNPGVRRFFYQTIPSWYAGENLGSLFTGELGGYTNKKYKERKSSILKTFGLGKEEKQKAIKTLANLPDKDILKSLQFVEDEAKGRQLI
jgi:hypothetical protein